MKKIKIVKFSDGSEGISSGNISINVSGVKQIGEETIELSDEEATKILDHPTKYKIKNKKVVKK